MSTAQRDRTVPARSWGRETSDAGGWTAAEACAEDRRPPVVEHLERILDLCSTPSPATERELATQ